jgi:hypothetical protein
MLASAAVNDTGHDEMDEHRQATYRARNAVWDAWGELDPYVMAPMINPGFMGGDFWPDTRQAHVAVRRPDAVLVASDGLSDPFGDPDAPRRNGWGVEFYAIATDPAAVGYRTVTDLCAHWVGDLVMRMSAIEAGGRHVVPALAEFGTLSVEFEGVAIPAEHRDRFVRDNGSVTVLINLTHPATLPAVIDGPLSPIHLVNLKLLTAAETATIITGTIPDQIAARRTLADRLAAQPDPLVSSLTRPSVL